jgi:hypothetical protein
VTLRVAFVADRRARRGVDSERHAMRDKRCPPPRARPAPPARGEKAQQTLRRVVTIGGCPVANRLSRRVLGENVTWEVTNSPSTREDDRPRPAAPPTPLPSMPCAAQRRKTQRGRPQRHELPRGRARTST